jgi:hypothetical protein
MPLDIKRIIGQYEEKHQATLVRVAAEVAENEETQQANAAALEAWARENLLPVLTAVEAELQELGYSVSIVQRTARQAIATGFGAGLKGALAEVELRVAPRKGVPAGASTYLKWSWEPGSRQVKLTQKLNSALDPSPAERPKVPLANLQTVESIEKDLQRFLLSVYR